jgi:hypothetical protein
LKGRWDDVEFVPECLVLDRAQTMTATVSVRADAPITLRFCFIGKDGSEADLCKTYRPGTTTFAVPLRDLQSRIGEIFGTHVVRIVFGGAGNAAVSVAMAVHDGEAAIYAGEQMAQVVGAREQMKLATTAPADGMAKSNRLSFALRAGLRAYRNASASA